MTLHLHGLGHYHPPNEITNRFLKDLDIGTDDEWIMDRVGIRSRRTVLPLDYIRTTLNRDTRAAMEAAEVSNAEAGRRAAEMAIERSGFSKSDIGMVIAGGCAPDTVSPAESCNIANALGLEVPAFDVNSACTSLIAAMNLLSWMNPDKTPECVLIVAAERLTTCVDYSDRAAAVLWGDGAAAAVVSHRIPGRAVIEGTSLESNPASCGKVVVPRTGHFDQEGRTVQTFAIKKTVRILKALAHQYRTDERPFHFVGHQANRIMLDSVCRLARISSERHHSNVEDFGNTAAAGSPSVISGRWDQWRDDEDIAVVGVGSGLTWGGFMIRFGMTQG
ncbi:MAG: ketoacyl-ACP synthase III [Thermoanaerobaculales bacterium]|nr:ketoacyl-ACP synthase III [Thermoanaerobaculales bacterium]